MAQAEADYRNALAGKSAMHTTINTTQNNILVTDAAIDEQSIRLQNAQTDYKRYQELLKEEAVTPQQFDRVKTDYEATQARYEQLLRQKQSTLLQKQTWDIMWRKSFRRKLLHFIKADVRDISWSAQKM